MSRSRLCIVHAAAATPLGLNLPLTWQRLLAGESGIRRVTRFSTEGFSSHLAAQLPELEPLQGRSRFLELVSLLLPALRPLSLQAGRTCLFTASTKAGIDALEQHMAGEEAELEAMLSARLRSLVCEELGLPPLPGENLSAACASGNVAFIRAAQAIKAGRCEAALVLAADLASRFTMSGFSALRALSAQPCRPFDSRRDGLTIGEGAAALLLMPQEQAEARGLAPLALLDGWGLAADARHITAPARDGSGLAAAMRQALQRAGRDSVDAVCAHGTGTVYNDAMELTAFETVFDTTPPFFSSKGALGHAMAASGTIEAALCCLALEQGVLPPTLGCDQPEERARGLACAAPQPFAGSCIMSCNSGFGGVNAAILLQHPGGGA